MPRDTFKQETERGLGFLITEVGRQLRADFRPRVAHLGLTQAEWQTLARLARHQGLRQTQLAEILEIQPITLTRHIDKLAEAGWVERRPDPDDRRAMQLFLTDAATPIMEELWDAADDMFAKALAGISQARRDQLIETLLAIKANLQSGEDPAAAASNKAKDASVAKDASENVETSHA
jgi:MarR family transcriptional regulator for hemolysin